MIDRAVALLDAIVQRPRLLNAQELASVCGLNRTTAWRILVALEHNDLVERDPETQRYGLGLRLARLGAAADPGMIIRIAHTALQELADEVGEQVSLGLPTHLGFTYIEHVQPGQGTSIPRWVGQSGPLHATASGKVFLSRLSEAERCMACSGPNCRDSTQHTIISYERLDAELATIRRDGFGITAGEHDELTSAVCAAVLDPQTGRLVAGIDVWGPSQRLTRRRLRELGPTLVRVARSVSEALSQQAPPRS